MLIEVMEREISEPEYFDTHDAAHDEMCRRVAEVYDISPDEVIESILVGEDLTFSIDSPFSGYHTVIFRLARVKQALPPAGAVWLYEELYRHKSGTGYEAHILLEAPTRSGRRRLQLADLFDLKLICSEICFA